VKRKRAGTSDAHETDLILNVYFDIVIHGSLVSKLRLQALTDLALRRGWVIADLSNICRQRS